MSIAVVGGGAMGSALVSGWLAAGHDPTDILVVEPDQHRAAELADRLKVRVAAPGEQVNADVVVLAVKPQQVIGVLTELSHTLPRSSLVVSIAAGVTLSALTAALPEDQPVFRVMPNTPALVGKGMSGLVAGPGTTPAQLEIVKGLLGAVGKVLVIGEEQIDALTAMSGSGPAYVFLVAEAMIEAGVHQGLTREQSTLLTNQTFVGAAEMLATSERGASELRERVTSPAGTTAAALRVLEDRGVRAAFLAAVEASARRSAHLQ